MGYFPPLLKAGDAVMIIAPTGGVNYVAESTIQHAIKTLGILGLDFGHTLPMATIPIGAHVSIKALDDKSEVIIHRNTSS